MTLSLLWSRKEFEEQKWIRIRTFLANDGRFYTQQFIRVQGLNVFLDFIFSFFQTHTLTTAHFISLDRRRPTADRPSFIRLYLCQPHFFFEPITSLPDIDKTLSDYTDCVAAVLRAPPTVSCGHICDNLFSSSQTLFLRTNSLKTVAVIDYTQYATLCDVFWL